MLTIPIVCRMKTDFARKDGRAFTLIELMIVVGIIALLTTLAVPNFARARDNSRLNMIYANLRTLTSAKDTWAMENNKTTGTPVADLTVLSNYFRWGGIQDVFHETYVPNPVGTPCQAYLPPGTALGSYGPGAAIAAP
jgi:prepilin-type N-terminal cleavage/methylation domain-containing protein